ncbi:F-box protein-like protein isoform X1 [Tanacetum coccineum]
MSNTDLLIEILLRLPVISLLLFKSVSKHWLSLITSPNFTLRRSLIPNIDPPSGLFFRFIYQQDYLYDLIRLDIRIPATSSRFETNMEGSNAYILEACNGLLLCYVHPDKYYVYNPSINLFKMLPQCNDLSLEPSKIAGHMKMAFDPTKSPHYKVVHSTIIGDDHFVSSIQIHTYSSQTRNWSSSLVCSDPIPMRPFLHSRKGIYWNDGIHWLTGFVTECSHYKLDIVNERPVLTTLQLPVNLDDEYPWNRKLFKTRGCLLLLGMDGTRSQRLNIYEMRYGYSEWSFKYFVNLNDIIMPFPERWFIGSGVGCIALGEREEDSLMVLGFNGNVILYKIVSKTSRELPELEPWSPVGSFLFTASFAGV